MNERIRELARVAEQLADDELAHLERVHNRLYSFTEGREIYNKKFAELIVQDCIGIVEAQKESLCENQAAWSHDDYGYERAVNDSVDMVKKHFGVDE